MFALHEPFERTRAIGFTVIWTALLIYAGELIQQGISPRRAATVAVTWSLTDEQDSKRAIDEVVKAIMPE